MVSTRLVTRPVANSVSMIASASDEVACLTTWPSASRVME